MFTRSVRVGCKFPACRQESVKYQLLPTLVSDPNFSLLATGLSVNLAACWYFWRVGDNVYTVS